MPEIDPFYLNEVRKLPCLACGKSGPSHAHHVRSRGAGGKDDYWNVIALCENCHVVGAHAWHKIGALTFCSRYPWVATYLMQLGWQFTNNKMIAPINFEEEVF